MNEGSKQGHPYELPADGWIAALESEETGDLNGGGPLRESKAWLGVIFDSIPTGILIVDSESHVIMDINPAAARMFGGERKHIIGSVCHRFICPAETGQCPITDLGKTVDNAERVLLTAGGGSCPVIKTVTPILMGGKTYLIESITDITDRKQAEEALRASYERYRRLFDEATEGIGLADYETGLFKDCNQAFLNLTGYERSELIGRPQGMIHPHYDENLPFTPAFELHRSEKRGQVLNELIVTKSGIVKEVEIKTDIIDLDGSKVMQGFFRDVTEERRGQREREVTLRLLRLLNDQNHINELVRSLTDFFKEWIGCEAVGIRLRQGDDFPYFETRGFSAQFVEAERCLCLKGPNGKPVKDSDGKPVLECLCGTVLSDRCDPDLPFFTQRGSFWTNNMSDTVSIMRDRGCSVGAHGRCSAEGYASVALIPLRQGNEILGLLQLNDHGADRFGRDMISLFENAAEQIGIAVAQRQAQAALAMSEKRFWDISEAAGESLLEMDPEGRLTFLSGRAMTVLEYDAGEILGRTPFDLMLPSEAEHARLLFGEHVRNRTGFRDLEVHMATKSGRMAWVNVTAVPMFDADGAFLGFRGAAMDITGRKQAEEQLLHNAFYDGLTDLPNRELFMDRLGHALKRANRAENYSCAVIFLDLDRFKVINDSLGHMVGDKLLKETARRLEKCVRPGDTVARLGGDEFVMLCEGTQEVEIAKAIAYRVQDVLSDPFMIEGTEIRSSASIGIALTSAEYERPEEVLRDADITMYRAKSLGRARCEVFDPSMRLEAAALLQLENDLRRALDQNELRIHYQPIVALGTGEATGLEALIRWQHPRRGLVPPGDFIPLAEETGLIVPIGEWVLRTACSQMKIWQEEGLAPLRMSINVSTVQLRQAGFVDMVIRVLAETGIDPELLDLEVTESVLVDRNESIIEMFYRLKALGIRICLDDFGTGYSSLSYLQGLPIDVLKIDASFTRSLTSDKERGKIVETILMLGKSLGTEVIAEGIETGEQLDYLKAVDCVTGQGFFFSKAVDEKAIRAMLSPRSHKSSQPRRRSQ